MRLKRICPVHGEEVLIEFRSSRFVLGGYLAGLVIALAAIITVLAVTGVTVILAYLGILIVFALVAGVIILNWYRAIFYVTNRRVKSCVGIVGSTEDEVTFDDVQSIEIHRSFWGAIFGFGDVIIEASGQGRQVVLTNVQDPQKIVDMISPYSVKETLS